MAVGDFKIVALISKSAILWHHLFEVAELPGASWNIMQEGHPETHTFIHILLLLEMQMCLIYDMNSRKSEY